jgi:hypothetical protein
MVREAEATPRPRAFAYSVHNAPAARAAMEIRAHGECWTFVHDEVSFAQALFAALAARRRTAGGPVLVGAVDESTAIVAEACRQCRGAPAPSPEEGGAFLWCAGEGAGGETLAWLHSPGLGRPGDPGPWLSALLEVDRPDLLLVHGPHLLRAAARIGGAVLEATRWVGTHGSAAAAAAALAVALVSGELPAEDIASGSRAPGRRSPEDPAEAPRRVAVASATRSGDLGYFCVSAAS